MKEQPPKTTTTNPKKHYSDNKNQQQPFFGATSDFFNPEVAQKKEAPFFEKVPRNSFFKSNNNSPSISTIQKQDIEKDKIPIQKKENNTGLPDNLKSGVENLSGYSMDDVKVHRNSDKPAQLNAHAYAQGTDIHLASGQEKHLPHEAWHLVQQKQGRVKPTMQMKGNVNINDDSSLEKEADLMGDKALQQKKNPLIPESSTSQKEIDGPSQFQELKGHSSVTQLIGGSSSDKAYKKSLWSELQDNYQITINQDVAARLETMGVSAVVYNHYINTPIPGFTVSNILFSSMSDDKVGSIYFPTGRIRLIHRHGPSINIHHDLERYVLSEHQLARLKNWRKFEARRTHYEGCKGYINQKLGVHVQAAVGQNGRLVEVKQDNTIWWHPSRGNPKAFTYKLTQNELNIIVNVAKTRDNNTLKNWMNAIPALVKIPTN